MARHGENIRKRKDGRWEARLLINDASTKKSSYKSFYGSSYEEVKNKRNNYYSDKIENKMNETMSEVFDLWLLHNKNYIKESTFSLYKNNIEKHIKPILGNYYSNQISNKEIEFFIQLKSSNGRLDRSKGLSAKTINNLLLIINASIKFGIEHGINFPNTITIHYLKQRNPSIRTLQQEEQAKLYSYCTENKSYINLGILLSLCMGLRIGEVCGLKWENVHIETNVLSIDSTALRISNHSSKSSKTKLIINSAKTENSIRTIPIPAFLIPLLKEMEKEDEYFLLTGTTKCMDPRNYYRKYKNILKSITLQNYNYHALRHTFATNFIEKNNDPKSLSEILGHNDINIMLITKLFVVFESKLNAYSFRNFSN